MRTADRTIASRSSLTMYLTIYDRLEPMPTTSGLDSSRQGRPRELTLFSPRRAHVVMATCSRPARAADRAIASISCPLMPWAIPNCLELMPTTSGFGVTRRRRSPGHPVPPCAVCPPRKAPLSPFGPLHAVQYCRRRAPDRAPDEADGGNTRAAPPDPGSLPKASLGPGTG